MQTKALPSTHFIVKSSVIAEGPVRLYPESLGERALQTPTPGSQKPLQQRVVEAIAKSLGRADAIRIGASASLTRDLRADALDKIEAIMALEDVFRINISDLDAKRIDTARDAVDCVFFALNRATRELRAAPQ